MEFIDLLKTVLIVLFTVSTAALYYIYDGYGRLLDFMLWRKRRQLPVVDNVASHSVPDNYPYLSVIIAAHNEEHQIVDKISDVLNTEYPAELIEILVASDHSTDNTEQLVQSQSDSRVRLVVHTGEQGKSAAQNTAVQRARGEVLVFTDSDTRFTPRFLYELTRPLTDPAVGAVDGHLIFVPPEYKDAMHMGPQSLYWKYELKLRHSESELGLLAVTSGACMAVRRELFKPLPSTVGEDCVVPLDVITAKRKVIHAQHALAYDIISEDLQTEFKARVRMTLRNWDGTWRYRHLLNPMLSPTYAFALWSHKVLRWLSPLFLGLGTVSALSLAAFSQIFGFVSAIFIAFYLVGAAGWLSARYDMPKIPFASTVLSFLMVNVSFLVGLLNYYRGKTIGAYTNKID